MLRFKEILAEYKAEIICIPLIFMADRISKILALEFLRERFSIHILPFFRLTYVENTGAAFGSFQNSNAGLALAAVVILFALFKWREEVIHFGKVARYALIFIAAGAFGNLYDRIVLGYVVDYFDFIVWPVFNIADSFITVGVLLLGYIFIKDAFKKYKEGK